MVQFVVLVDNQVDLTDVGALVDWCVGLIDGRGLSAYREMTTQIGATPTIEWTRSILDRTEKSPKNLLYFACSFEDAGNLPLSQ